MGSRDEFQAIRLFCAVLKHKGGIFLRSRADFFVSFIAVNHSR